MEKKNIKWMGLSVTTWSLVLLIIILSVMLIYCFVEKKEGRNADEVWSYTYANGVETGSLCYDRDGNVININKWMDSKYIQDALTVADDERFLYRPIYENQINDYSPPFHSYILHTICSFFPGTYSTWYAFAINFVSFIITIIYMYKWIALIKNERFAMLCCAFYGFSMGFVDLFIYLRMYALETALFMAAIYYIFLYLKKDGINIRCLIISAVISFLGFLTSYYYISAMGLLTFFLCVYMLFSKKIKKMFALGFSMLGSMLLSIAYFPAILNIPKERTEWVSVNTEANGNFNFNYRCRMMADFFLNRECGVNISYYYSGYGRIAIGIFAIIIIVSLPLLWLFRNTKPVGKVFDCLMHPIYNLKQFIYFILNHTDWITLILLAVFILQSIVIGETCFLGGMLDYSVRYQLFVFPLGVYCLIYITFGIINLLSKLFGNRGKIIRIIVCAALCTVCICNNLYRTMNYSLFYFMKNTEGIPMKQEIDGSYVVYVDSAAWHIIEMAPEFMDSKQYFQTKDEDYKKYTEQYKEKLDDGKMILVIDLNNYYSAMSDLTSAYNIIGENDEKAEDMKNHYDSLINYFEELVPDSEMKLISKELHFGDVMEAYVVNP